MKKRVLALALALTLVLSMVPVAVSAEEPEVKASAYAGQHDGAKHAGDCGTDKWVLWDTPNALPPCGDGNHYYLGCDVTLNAEYSITGNLDLCLNGYVIRQTTNNRVMSTKANTNATVNICDCTAQTVDGVYHAGAITGGKCRKGDSGGGVIFVRRGGIFHLYGGRLTRNDATYLGGAIHAQGSSSSSSYAAPTIYIHGGELSNNKAISGTTNKKGGAIYMTAGSELVITGGSFVGNTGSDGGAIYTDKADVSIANATFTGNIASGNGGAVALSEADLILHSGTFTGNEANYGAVINGGTNCTVDIRGGTMTGNDATANGGAVNAASKSCDIKFSGNPQITGNTRSGSTADNVRLGNSGVIDVQALADTARVGLTIGSTVDRALSTAVDKDYSVNFPSDNAAYETYLNGDNMLQMRVPVAPPPPVSNHIHCQCGKEGCTDPTHEQVTYYKWDQPGLPDVGNWYLEGPVNVTAYKQLETDGTLNLCLNGQTITGYTGSQARAYSTKAGTAVTINICDHTATGEGEQYQAGKITGFTNTNTNSGAAGIYVRSGATLNFYGGIISDCYAATGGVALMTNGGTIHFYNGLLKNNQAFYNNTWKNGGAMTVQNGTLVVHGGTITGNSANYGGALYAIATGSSTSTLDIRGGKITGNTANTGGAVYAGSAGCDIKFSGNPQITGNSTKDEAPNNVQLGEAVVMDIKELADTARIGITADAGRALSNVVARDYSVNYPSDDPNYLTYLNADSKLALKASYVHEHCVCGKGDCTDTTHEKISYNPWYKENELPVSGSYCLMADVVTTVDQAYVAGELKLCLHGKTVTVGQGCRRAYSLSEGDKLTITDCKGTGKITGASAGAVLTSATAKNMAVNLYSGSFTGNHAKATGGALVIQGGCTFNMYGGAITGNSVTSVLKTDDQGKPVLDSKGNQDYDAYHGGGLYVGSGAVFNMYGGQITNNEAKPVEYGKASGAKATDGGNGGGMQVATGAVANLYGGKISGNKGVLGGGFMVKGEGSRVNLLGTELSDNTASNGAGGISQTKAVITMQAGKITGNKATVNGGGLYGSTGTALQMTGGTISGNKAYQGAGITVLSAQAQLTGGTITGNQADNGAGLYVFTTTSGGKVQPAEVLLDKELLITGNTVSAKGNGGGVLVSGESARLVMAGGKVTQNTARNAGGILIQSKAAFTLQGGEVAQNKATNGGGGVYISTDSTFEMTGGKIHSNAAPNGDGGGMYLLRCTARLAGGSVNNNTAANGGGVRVGGATVAISGLNVEGNKAPGKQSGDTVSGGNGAGILIGRAGYKVSGVQKYAIPAVTVTNMYVSGNISRSSGSGVLVQSEGTVFTMQGGTITGNTSKTGNGGGLYLSTNTKSTITGGTISANKAKNSGGMHVYNAKAQVSGVKFKDNEATSASGAFAISGKNAVVNMKNVEISGNVAGGSAGVCAIQSYGTLHLENAKLYNNTATNAGGAIYFSNPGYGSLTDVQIYENRSGKQAGGLFVGPASEVTADNVTIRDNVAGSEGGGGVFNRGKLEIKNSKILNNTAQNANGGGICGFNSSSILTGTKAGIFAENCIISGNKASQGGGVYGYRGCPTYLTDCVIEGNTAEKEGSGIFADGRLGLSNVTVTGNTSKADGYALYVMSSLFDGHSYHTGHKRISGDMIVKDNQGGDMFLCEGAVVAVTGETLGEKAYVKVTLQSGVLTQCLQGVYDYEGGNGEYVVTAGSRSITDPEPIPGAQLQGDPAANHDIWLYAGVGVFVLAVAAVVIVLIAKKKKAGAATEVSKD